MGRNFIYDIMFGAFAVFIICLILAAFIEMRRTCHYLNQESIAIQNFYKEERIRLRNIREMYNKEGQHIEQNKSESWCESEGLQSGGVTQWEKVENNRED